MPRINISSMISAFMSGGMSSYVIETGNHEYGSRSRGNGKHFVQFNAREVVPPNVKLAGGANNEEPSNANQNLLVPRPPTRRSKGSVILYMPAQINVSQKANYGEPEMGKIVAGGISGAKNLSEREEGIGGMVDALTKTFQGTTGGAKQLGADFLEGAGATGLGSAAQISSGKVINNTTELMFEGIDRRAFTFSFRLIPHNAQEAASIQAIVKQFRYHMAPAKPGGRGAQYGRTLIVPSTYDITYSHQEELHKISECVLESVDVKYGGERPQFYRDDRPTETELTLQFKELEIMTKDRIADGF